MNKLEILQRMQELVPVGCPAPEDPNVLRSLETLTADLIAAYKAEGTLKTDPFADVHNRTIYLYEPELRHLLTDKVVLITGGEGCVGTHLGQELAQLGVKRIVSIDNARLTNSSVEPQTHTNQPEVVFYVEDVRNYAAIDQIFEIEKPAIVFHLAAQRLPWLGELQIRETATTNILGTRNIIQVCEQHGVLQCIFSSTGKSAKYLTTQVYAATKKIAEWLFAQAAQTGRVQYGMVRFTHILGNSSVCQQIDSKIQAHTVINIHAPNRYIVAQNADEASHLLLNALILSTPNQLKLITVRNLGWPVETLEIALYKIAQSGQSLPIYFQGVQAGYEEPFFIGEVDWSDPKFIFTLINALETPQRVIDSSGDMYVTHLPPFSTDVLTKNLSALEDLFADPETPDIKIKKGVAETVRQMTHSILVRTDPHKLAQILRWSINPKQFDFADISLSYYRDVLDLFVQALDEAIERQAHVKKLPLQAYPKEFQLAAIPAEISSSSCLCGNPKVNHDVAPRKFSHASTMAPVLNGKINLPHLLTPVSTGE
jgi:NAD(P)-dependent dehydrogenase (short-subunit alcohol dehydrogenase family)